LFSFPTPLPRKGMETRFFLWGKSSQMLSNTSSPKGDGNVRCLRLNVAIGLLSNTSSPKGDGNLSLVLLLPMKVNKR
jgi:hypothetical protein